MFRARVSWTLIGAIGLLGLTSDFGVGARGALLGVAIAGFIWLNRPLLTWIVLARGAQDARWKPMAVGMALRLVGLAAVIAVSW